VPVKPPEGVTMTVDVFAVVAPRMKMVTLAPLKLKLGAGVAVNPVVAETLGV